MVKNIKQKTMIAIVVASIILPLMVFAATDVSNGDIMEIDDEKNQILQEASQYTVVMILIWICVLIYYIVYYLGVFIKKIFGKHKQEEELKDRIVEANDGKRFLNFMIDFLLLQNLSYFLAYLLLKTSLAIIDVSIIFPLVFFVYYFIMEGAFGRTLGKIVTRTRVISTTGNKINFPNAFARTIIRFIPFEPISVVLKGSSWWHDKWTDTMVVNSSFIPYNKSKISLIGNNEQLQVNDELTYQENSKNDDREAI